jgi:phage baseplate assembly protein gpV
MSVMVHPMPDSVSLRVTGDITTTLTVPYDDDDRFLLGFSDGTLLIGTYDEDLECGWQVARNGAGFVRVIENTAVLEWRAEWVTVSIYDANVAEPLLPDELPLFPDLDRWAA